jgi:hypothetical protein
VLLLAVGLGLLAGAGTASATPITVQTFTPAFKEVGTVNLSTISVQNAARTPGGGAAALGANYRVVRSPVLHALKPTTRPSALRYQPVTGQNPAGEFGFTGITGYLQAAANGNVDLEPPDQGLCAGDGYVADFVNNAFTVYEPDGAEVLPVIPSYAIFKQPSTAFMSDPRCRYDSATQRWILTEFVVGTATAPSLQFIAVSNTKDPTGTYTIWQFNTTDKTTKGCPCFGDYDELGVDQNGIYITTDEFPDGAGAYNGVIVYAVSKQLLETEPTTGIVPVVFGYRLTTDAFGQPYIVSPASTPDGATFARNTEYFVESNGNAASDNHLIVYGMNDTSELANNQAPNMYSTRVTTQSYAFPFADAKQKVGPFPLGQANQDPEGQLQADFDAVMQTTYVGGQVYAELTTELSGGNLGSEWFILKPTFSGSALTATVTHQGLVSASGQSLVYPAIGLDSAGSGYMTFALSGPSYFPSAAYIAFGSSGPTGDIITSQRGAAPEDGFTCYAAFVGPSYGGCRWGDYSAATSVGSTIYMATEMIPPQSRDELTNWGTFVWSAPAP